MMKRRAKSIDLSKKKKRKKEKQSKTKNTEPRCDLTKNKGYALSL